MAVRSRRLWVPASLAAGAVVLYTVPAGRTALLKTLVFRNTHTAAVTLSIGIGNSTGVGMFHRVTLQPDTYEVVETWIVLEAGGTFNGASSVAISTARISGHGSLLMGVPE